MRWPKRLVAVSDIVTESFAPGFLNRVGLGWDDLRQVRPDLIMASMSMEGQTGPHAGFRGFGLTLQATAGVTAVTGWPDRSPVGTGVAYTDWIATHVAIVALLAALDHRRRTGEGQYIDVSQLEASTVILDAGLIDALNTGRVHRPLGNRACDTPRTASSAAPETTAGARSRSRATSSGGRWRGPSRANRSPTTRGTARLRNGSRRRMSWRR